MDTRAGPADRRSGRTVRVPTPVGVRLTTLQRLGATGGIAVIVSLLGLLAYGGLTSTRSAREGVISTHRAIEATQSVLQDVTNAETGQRGFLLSGDERYLAPYHAALNRLDADTALLRTLAGGDPVQKGELDSLSRAVETKLSELSLTISLMRAKGSTVARAEVDADRGKHAMDDIRELLRNVATRQQSLLDQHIAESERHYDLADAVIVAGTIAAIVIALMLNTLLTRFANAQADGARRLNAQNRELSDTNQKLSELTFELELQNQQLQEQAAEMESQQSHLQEQATELEMQSEELTSHHRAARAADGARGEGASGG